MKKGFKIFLGVVGGLYLAIIIFLTVCLLNYNDYNISDFKNKVYLIIDNDELEPEYNEGSLVVIKKTKLNEIAVGDYIFFYNTYNEVVDVSYTKVIAKEQLTEDETTFTLEGDKALSGTNVIGAAKEAKEYKGFGSFLGFLESKWGYLFIVIVPVLFIFIYEIYAFVKELKLKKKESKK